MIQGIVLVLIFAIAFVMLVMDLIYPRIDPRINLRSEVTAQRMATTLTLSARANRYARFNPYLVSGMLLLLVVFIFA